MQTLARWLLRVTGWTLHGSGPDARRYVLVAAPHTSNWDLLWLLLMAAAASIRISWLAKHTLFWGPVGWLLSALGGVPVIRHERRDMVAAIADTLRNAERLVIVIPPEGTRRRAEYWKSGFYQIARQAGVPVVPTALDYAKRHGEFGAPVSAQLDPGPFMDEMRAFYDGRSGRYPEKFGPVRLRDETLPPESD